MIFVFHVFSNGKNGDTKGDRPRNFLAKSVAAKQVCTGKSGVIDATVPLVPSDRRIDTDDNSGEFAILLRGLFGEPSCKCETMQRDSNSRVTQRRRRLFRLRVLPTVAVASMPTRSVSARHAGRRHPHRSSRGEANVEAPAYANARLWWKKTKTKGSESFAQSDAHVASFLRRVRRHPHP